MDLGHNFQPLQPFTKSRYLTIEQAENQHLKKSSALHAPPIYPVWPEPPQDERPLFHTQTLNPVWVQIVWEKLRVGGQFIEAGYL